jgi:hypothetical protein
MTMTSAEQLIKAWQRPGRRVRDVAHWPDNGRTPYSPLLCVGLLLTLSFIVNIAG